MKLMQNYKIYGKIITDDSTVCEIVEMFGENIKT